MEGLPMDVISLTIDSKKRISLNKLLPPGNIRSVRAYTKGYRIVLEPMIEVPVEEGTYDGGPGRRGLAFRK